jgi:uncharacterized phage protein (TIGR02220 family)
MELQYFKITVDDFEMAQNHFENDKHLGEFVIALFWYYKTDKYPENLSKPVEKYFKVYYKTAKFIQSQRKKRLGKVNLEVTENQTDNNIRLATNLPTETEPTQQPKVNISKDKLKKVNISSETIDWVIFLDWFNKTTNKNFRTINNKTKSAFNQRIKDGYKKEDFMTAIINCFNDPYHKENPKYLTPEFISRPDKLEKYLNATPKVVSLPNNWWDIPLTDEQWAMLPTDKAKEKRLNDLRKKIG